MSKALDKMLKEATNTGTRPSVLALARQFGLANTTFRRHFPEIARQLTDARASPAAHTPGPRPVSRYDTLIARNARLRRANQNLTAQLKLAAAQIQWLALESCRLRQELEGATGVTRIGSPGLPR